MDGKEGRHAAFVHLLLYRCQECEQPLATCIMSAERNLERIDGTSFTIVCKCGWSKSLLGMQAIRHWLAPWSNEGGLGQLSGDIVETE
jgi:hypothetical protein